jgi:UDP-N-acetylmuramate--alanine ligase
MIKPDLQQQIPAELGRVHFVGIGGSGMSGIARVFLAAGHTVSGSDIRETAGVAALRELGAEIAIGHDEANVGDADTLVVTGALWQDNPEYQRALRDGLPVLHRSQALAWLIGQHRLVSVAGAHGKTTSTGMIVTALLAAGHDPSFVNGGVIQSLGVSAGGGSDDLFVVEADESDGSFLLYDTSVALITNVDADHLDHYGSHDAFDAAFVEFAAAARELVVVSSDDAGARRVTSALRHPHVVTFGEHESSDVRLSDIASSGPVSFCASPGTTTPSTRLVRSPSSWGSASSRRRRSPASRPSAARSAASSCTARSGASASTTTTRTTRPRWPPRCRRPGPWSGTAASSRCTSRTSTAAPG